MLVEPLVPGQVRVFVYGSLKRGEVNHERYCGGYLSTVPATVWGRLYRQSSGYPMLLLPSQHALAQSSGNALADTHSLLELGEQPLPAPIAGLTSSLLSQGDWQAIEGELLLFDNAATRLSDLDALEEFFPGAPSLYHRVIVPVMASNQISLAWTYVAPAGILPADAERTGPRWP